jgi:uncharacterized membrane protein YgcG
VGAVPWLLAQSARSLLALITLALPAAAQTFPALSGRVVLPKAKVRQGRWQWLNYVDPPKTGRWASSHSAWAASSSSSSGSSSSFSGGGGSSGGGGASGSW